MHRDCTREDARRDFKAGVHNGDNRACKGGCASGIGLTKGGGWGALSLEDSERSMTASTPGSILTQTVGGGVIVQVED